MSKVDSYKCDQCGKQKQEVNHWYMAYRDSCGELVIERWEDKRVVGLDAAKHLCGQACVIGEVQKWMGGE